MPKVNEVEFELIPRCSGCNKLVTDPKEGFIVHGNIYAAIEEESGYIGDNFPSDDVTMNIGQRYCKEDEKLIKIDYEHIREAVGKVCYCKRCFANALDIVISDKRGSA